MTPLLAGIIVYVLAQFAIGAWASRRVRTEDDYLVAGRRLGYPLTVFSVFATWFGAETCIGAAGRAYSEGLSRTSVEPFGYGLCLVVMGAVYAVPLWRRKLTTLADLFRERYSATVERCAAIMLVPSSVLWAAAQIRGFGHVLTSAAPMRLAVAMAIAAAVCMVYTALGGLLADAVTDFVQGLVLVAGVALVGAALVDRLGGLESAVEAFRAGRAAAASAGAAAGGGGSSLLAVAEAWAIPVCGSALATELVSRVIAARTPAVARNGTLLASGLYLAVGIVPVCVGLAGAALVPALDDPEQFLPALARELLPATGYALFAGALVSAILSTVDTTLLVASGLVSHNLLVPVLGERWPRLRSQRARVLLARGGVIALGIVAWGVALSADGVFALVEQASAFGGAGALVTVTFGLFTRFGGPATALATLVGSTASYLAASFGDLPYPFLASLATALLLYVAGGAAEALRARSRRRVTTARAGSP